MMVVSLFLPYAELAVRSPRIPSVSTSIHIQGIDLRYAIYTVFLALICTVLILLKRNNTIAIIVVILVLLIGINLISIPKLIWFATLDYAPFGLQHDYQLGFYIIMESGISMITIAFINLILVLKNPPKEDITNSDLIDDLE
jgi:hypothetical protein